MNEELDRKYLKNGSAVVVNSTVPNGFLVQRILENGDTEEEWVDDAIFFVDAIFDAAPTQALDERIVQLRTQIQVAQKEYEEIRKLKQEAERVRSAIKGYPELEKIAVLFESNEYWVVKRGTSIPTAKPERRRQSDNIYCSLEIKNHVIKVTWKSSGSYDDYASFHATEQEANEYAIAKITEAMKAKNDSSWEWAAIIAAAKLYNIPLTSEFKQHMMDVQKNGWQKKLDEARKSVSEAEIQLAKLTA